MFKSFRLLIALFLCLVIFSPPGFSQVDAGSPAESSQEVEVNEDMYRQFMELKDARQQRMILPEDAFKAGSGSQTLDKLPEESQKHLRNQLREIILQAEGWKPGDENADYPYVPSQAAAGSPELQQQEAAAWNELLDGYHKREAQIYANSARSKAAMASQSGQAGTTGQGPGQNQPSGDGSAGQSPSTEESTRQNPVQQAEGPQSEIPDSAKITSSSSSAGVSQNAMEFLQGMQNQPGQNKAAQSSESRGEALADSSAESGPGGPETEPNKITEQSDSPDKSSDSRMANSSSDNAAAQNTTGVSQNALEFLQQSGEEGKKDADQTLADTAQNNDGEGQLADSGDPSGDDDDSEKPANTNGESETYADRSESGDSRGATQNALEYVIGEQPAQQNGRATERGASSSTSGTLSINELVNARGVGKGSKPVPLPPIPKEKTPPSDSPPEKDGG